MKSKVKEGEGGRVRMGTPAKLDLDEKALREF